MTILTLTLSVGFAQEAPASPVPAGLGRLTGLVLDAADAPVVGAEVRVIGGTEISVSDASGRYTLDLAPGDYVIDPTAVGLDPYEFPEARVVDGRVSEVVVRMVGLGKGNIEVVTVYAPVTVGAISAAIEERKQSASVAEVMGQEQMVKSGDSTAAAALTRATGLTIVDGRFAYVRGMGDRYSATLLNGSGLPSTEPEKRVVPLDLFPTALVETMSVQKSFSPDMPAEFGGGLVDVRTRRMPVAPLFSLQLSGTWRGGVTLEEGNIGAQGPTDFFGYGNDFRALPDGVADASEAGVLKPAGRFTEGGYTHDQLYELGESLPDHWAFDKTQAMPNVGLSLAAGRRWSLGSLDLGGLIGLVFDNSWDIDRGSRSVYSLDGDELVAKRITSFEETSNTGRLGGGVTLGAEWTGGQYVQATTIYSHSGRAEALTWLADDPTGDSDTQNYRTGWSERQLFYQQLGAHVIVGPIVADARYAYSAAEGNEPDRREWTYNIVDGAEYLATSGSWNEIRYGQLLDHAHDGRLDLTLPFLALGGEQKVAIGGQLIQRDRVAATRRFEFDFSGVEGFDLTLPVADIVTPETIGPTSEDDTSYLDFLENTASTDDYSATQGVIAGYAMADLKLLRRLRALVGARVENSTQAVETAELFATEEAASVRSEISTLDVLPAATFTLGLGAGEDVDTVQLRAGYGRTLSRPELRELSVAAFYDYRTGRLLFGNPDLQRATIENVDLRVEWYPSDGEALSVGGFFKYLDHPIESVVAVSAVSGSVGTFANATSAVVAGGEVDVRKELRFLPGAAKFIYVAVNGALIHSEVDLSEADGSQTSAKRPLQGQSPWVVNAQVGWDFAPTGTGFSLLYNVFGPRLVEVGSSGLPDTWEQPVHRLDALATQKLGPAFKLRAKATNLLDWPLQTTTGDQISEETRDGWSAGLSLSWAPPP